MEAHGVTPSAWFLPKRGVEEALDHRFDIRLHAERTAGAWHDVDRIRGSYVETGLDLRVPVLPSRHPIVGLYLVSLAGWSLGQETDRAKPEEPAYFSASGLTHVDLGLDVRVGGELRYLSTEIHVVFRPDSGARGSANSGEAWWLGVGASDAWILGVF